MENKEIIFLTPGETTLGNFFLWLRNTVVRILNKQWVVTLPPNAGIATVRDSRDRVTIDLSRATFGGVSAIATAQDGTGAGEPLVGATFAGAVWTIHARNIKDATYTRVSQTATDIQIEGASLIATNAGGTDGYVLQDPATYNSGTNEFTVTANGINGGSFIVVTQASGTDPIVADLRPQPGSGRRFLAFEADGSVVLVGEDTGCEA